ncbi:MAG: TonB-dependent receptor plug domain-containing protein [Gemmatimonadales bacterium]
MHDLFSIGRWSAVAVVALASASGAVHPALAQEEPLANVLGRVVQAGSGASLAEAVVEMPELELARETDKSGRFWFRNVPAGERVFVIYYLGYADTTQVVLVPAELNQLEVAVELTVVPVPDLMVQVEALDAPSKLTEFNRRRDKGEGYFITRADILRRDPVRTTDLLRSVPGVRIASTNTGQASIRMRGGRHCPVAYFVDGIRAPYFNLDTVLPSSVEGIEIYKGTASVPPEFRGPLTPCAAIVLWTRDPGLP